MNAKAYTSTHAHQRISHLAQVVHLCFYTLLYTDVAIAHQDHLSHAHTKASIYVYILCMHSAVARHNDMCKQPVILGDGTNLCLQAETDMITTDEGRHEMEDQILTLYYSVFPLVSDSFIH